MQVGQFPVKPVWFLMAFNNFLVLGGGGMESLVL
jgi:hypothetical protein